MRHVICSLILFFSFSLLADRTIILMGAPGSGKGTQAALLSDFLSVPALSIGTVMRAHVARGNDLSRVLQNYEYNEEVNRPLKVGLMIEAISQAYDVYKKNEIILDAWPKDLETLDLLQKVLFRKDTPIVIELAVEHEELETRVIERKVCPNPLCGKSFGSVYKAPVNNHCDKCNTELEQRAHERGAAFKQRLQRYEARYQAMVEAYKRYKIPWHRISAQASPQEIHGKIMFILETVRHW